MVLTKIGQDGGTGGDIPEGIQRLFYQSDAQAENVLSDDVYADQIGGSVKASQLVANNTEYVDVLFNNLSALSSFLDNGTASRELFYYKSNRELAKGDSGIAQTVASNSTCMQTLTLDEPVDQGSSVNVASDILGDLFSDSTFRNELLESETAVDEMGTSKAASELLVGNDDAINKLTSESGASGPIFDFDFNLGNILLSADPAIPSIFYSNFSSFSELLNHSQQLEVSPQGGVRYETITALSGPEELANSANNLDLLKKSTEYGIPLLSQSENGMDKVLQTDLAINKLFELPQARSILLSSSERIWYKGSPEPGETATNTGIDVSVGTAQGPDGNGVALELQWATTSSEGNIAGYDYVLDMTDYSTLSLQTEVPNTDVANFIIEIGDVEVLNMAADTHASGWVARSYDISSYDGDTTVSFNVSMTQTSTESTGTYRYSNIELTE
jgi:hypothetical protein